MENENRKQASASDDIRPVPRRTEKHDHPMDELAPAPEPWNPPMSLNPWARAFDGNELPDEPFMGSNKKPKQLSDMLPYPDPAQADRNADRPEQAPKPEMR